MITMPKQQHKTPESMPKQETETYQTTEEPETESSDSFKGTTPHPKPMITYETLKIVREKEDAENRLKEISLPKDEEYSGNMRVSMSPEEERNWQKEFAETIGAATKAVNKQLTENELAQIKEFIHALMISQTKTKEIVETKTYACPHCGGMLKNKE